MRSPSWTFFGFLSFVILAGSFMKTLPLVPLYTDSALRLQTQEIVTITAAQRGWLLSGVEILSVTTADVVLRYRQHTRGTDDLICLRVSLETPESLEIPCKNA